MGLRIDLDFGVIRRLFCGLGAVMRAGTVIDNRYVVIRLAGSGGMADVYEAQERGTGQSVAVKILHGFMGTDVARFYREAQLLTELDHPHIVRAYARGELASGEPYLALEWLEGEPLSARLARGPLTIDESVTLGIRVADALAFAHARGIVHRDLKPANIFLPNGRIDAVKILDFGIARVGGVTETQPGAVLGTPGYMAPEQVRGEPGVDARADVFSLGCVLFECLSGEQAFAGIHPLAILTKILFDEPPNVRERCPNLPLALDVLVQNMLSKHAEGRPKDGAAVAQALRTMEGLTSISEVQRGRSEVLTTREQQAVAVLLVGPPARNDGGGVNTPVESLRLIVDDHGGRFEQLMDGSIAILSTGTGLATDVAAQVARLALVLTNHCHGRALALAMGLCDVTGRLQKARVIDRAARLMEDVPAAEGHIEVILDDVTAGLLGVRFDVSQRGSTWVLHDEREPGQDTRTLLGKATPCLGRELELRLLEGLYAECVDQELAQAATVVAPAGTGKSRLAREFLRGVRSRSGVTIWIGSGEPIRSGSALGLLGQVVRNAIGIRDGEPLEARRKQLTNYVAELIRPNDQRRIAVFLGEIAGTSFPDEESSLLHAARRDAALMHEQMQTAFVDLVEAQCATTPTLILLEDLHWGDQATVQFIDLALRKLAERPLFVFSLARPEIHTIFPNLWMGRRNQEVKLNPLSKRAIERLSRHVLGEKAVPEVIERFVKLSEGNAFYLEELIRATAEGKGANLPETAVAMVQSRLGALDDVSRRLLRAASIFGEVFWEGGVMSLLGSGERITSPAERLARLAASEIIIRRNDSRYSSDIEYAFRHALLREGAYAMLTDEDRVLGHRLAGEWLEERGEQDALVLAEHFDKGGQVDRACRYYLRAAEAALRTGQLDAAEARLDSLPMPPRTSLEKSHACRIRMAVQTTRGSAQDAITTGLDTLAELGLDIPRDEPTARMHAELEHARVWERVAARGIHSLADADPLNDPDKRAMLEVLTNLLAPANLVRPALFSLCSAIQANISIEYGHADESIYGYMLYGMHLATALGRYTEAGGFGRLALALDKRRGSAGEPCRMNFVYGSYAHFLEPLRDVLEYLRKAHDTGLSSGDFICLSYACSHVVLLRLALGDSLQAVDEETVRFLTLMERTKVASSIAVQTLARRMIAALTGQTANLRTLSGPGFDEDSYVASLRERGVHFAFSWYRAIQITLAFLSDDYEGVLTAADDGNYGGDGTWFYFATDAVYFTCLAAGCLCPQGTDSASQRYAVFESLAVKISAWANACPANYEHKRLLIDAEKGRMTGDFGSATVLYERAIATAAVAGFSWHVAVACERAAQFHRGLGHADTARKLASQAIEAYEAWGARAVIDRVRKTHAEVLSNTSTP